MQLPLSVLPLYTYVLPLYTYVRPSFIYLGFHSFFRDSVFWSKASIQGVSQVNRVESHKDKEGVLKKSSQKGRRLEPYLLAGSGSALSAY